MNDGDAQAGGAQRGRPGDPFERRDAFLGCPLSTTIATGLADVVRRVDGDRGGAGGAGLRWVAPPHLHLNLRHLGPMYPEHLRFLVEQLATALGATERFPVHLGDFELWPRPEEPRALWVRVVDDEGALGALRRLLDETLAVHDFAPPPHPFEPHITLALVDSLADPADLVQRATTHRGGAVGRFWIPDVQLYAAPLAGRERAPYEPWARVALQRRTRRAGDEADEERDDGGDARAAVQYYRPVQPTPRVVGGGRPVLPGERRLRRINEAFDDTVDSGDSAPEAEFPAPDETPDETEAGE